jgi:branched-chain amino acid transport system ATP-binding protein
VSEPLLQAHALVKSYGGLRVTDGLDLDVMPGELHAVIGPNGAGKTTLVHQLSGLARPDSGTIRFMGEDVTTLPMPARARRGLVRSFQITSILPAMTVLDNVALGVQAVRGSSFRFLANASRERGLNDAARALLRRFHLEPRAQAIAGALSHGEKRQLELAMALAAEPKMLLLDEPLAGTSHDEAGQVVDLLRSLKGTVAILLVEHDMDAVFALADTITVIVQGRVVARGAPDAIRASAEVRAAYLGEEV